MKKLIDFFSKKTPEKINETETSNLPVKDLNNKDAK